MPDAHFDLIVIGSGPGGATLVHRLAPTGKRILLIERGDYLPRSVDNWNPHKVFVENIYQAAETWYDKHDKAFPPGLHYYVGGNSKMYGAALFRLRERDFEEIHHVDGISPAWPLKYDVFEPYYSEAERLYHVHGAAGEDPTEPRRAAPYPYPPVSHEPRMQELADSFLRHGLHPFHMPLGILLDEKDGKVTPTSICIRNPYFDGYPCLTNGKADAEVICVDPTLARYPNVSLLTGAYVSKLDTDATGRTIKAVRVERGDVKETYAADIVVVACGALSSALLLLRSANDRHPHGLANGSDQVGRNYLRHNQSVLM
ncbi:MAG: GMC family oxidoreductase N-terminal domain-containing protein, partial [Casimicrobiaceae bacterium]